ncbi:MAG: hypothetical protein Kow0037_23450 [Calditrichia bacterium]
MYKKIATLILVGLFLLMAVGCGGGQKARKAQSVVDSPAIHYDRGMDLLMQGKSDDAMFEFKQAKSLDPKYAPAYEGMGWVYLEQKNYQTAETMANQALDLDGKWVAANLIKAKVYAGRGDYEKGIKEARNAIKDIPGSSVPNKRQTTILGYLTLGDIHKLAGQYNEAQDAYSKVMEIDKTNQLAAKAIKELAAYKTAVAGQRPELRKIAEQKEITRADVAVLFASELPLQKIFRQAPQPQQAGFRPPTENVMGQEKPAAAKLPPDVPNDHWARSFIQEVLEKGVMEVGPDGNFNPGAKVNRAEFARLIEKFMVRYWNDPKLETRFFGQMSPFADVNNTAPTFNAIMTVSSRGIMPGFEDGTFKPLGAVSGTDALVIIKNLKSKL